MADIRKSIEEARIEERAGRWKKILEIGVVILVVAAGIFLYASNSTSHVSYGNPDKLSYGIPDHSSSEVVLTDKKILPAVCTSNGTLICTEPVVESFFVQNMRTHISRYEQYAYFRLKNTGNTALQIAPAMQWSDVECLFDGKNLTLSRGGISERLNFFCISPDPPEKLDALWYAGYFESGIKKESFGTVKAV